MPKFSKIDFNTFILYSDREKWSDVKPIPQVEGDSPVVKIAYSDKC